MERDNLPQARGSTGTRKMRHLPSEAVMPLAALPSVSPHPPGQLQRLVTLRWIEVASQLLVLALAVQGLGMDLPMTAMASVSLSLLGVNLLTWLRLGRHWPVLESELFVQLLIDVAALTALLYLSGGSANPFVSLLLLPLTIAAISLTPGYAWAMAAATVAAYTTLMALHLPLPSPSSALPGQDALLTLVGAGPVAPAPVMDHSSHAAMAGMDHGDHGAHAEHSNGGSFSLHLLGMWFNFLVSAAVVGFFLTRMAATLRTREQELAAAREEALRNEQILALGTLAAGAAHQLGTPLSTLAVLLREMEMDHPHGVLADDLALARQQVDHCKATLSALLARAGTARREDARAVALADWLGAMVDRWQLLRPSALLSTRLDGPAVTILDERSLEQALLNLLDNAADASPEQVELDATWNERECILEILDRGPGLDRETAGRIGQAFISTKAGGLGIGLFLSNATIERFGGKVELYPRPSGGTCTRVSLALGPLALTPKA